MTFLCGIQSIINKALSLGLGELKPVLKIGRQDEKTGASKTSKKPQKNANHEATTGKGVGMKQKTIDSTL